MYGSTCILLWTEGDLQSMANLGINMFCLDKMASVSVHLLSKMNRCYEQHSSLFLYFFIYSFTVKNNV